MNIYCFTELFSYTQNSGVSPLVNVGEIKKADGKKLTSFQLICHFFQIWVCNWKCCQNGCLIGGWTYKLGKYCRTTVCWLVIWMYDMLLKNNHGWKDSGWKEFNYNFNSLNLVFYSIIGIQEVIVSFKNKTSLLNIICFLMLNNLNLKNF